MVNKGNKERGMAVGSEVGVSRTRIAKNTLLLYIRTAINIIVGLYSSRLVLRLLGEEDFGIYSVIGGAVILAAFFTSALNSATTRQISYVRTKGTEEEVQSVFGACVCIHWLLVIFFWIVAGSVGVWLLQEFLVFPPERYRAVLYVYALLSLSVGSTLLTTPFQSVLTSYENFNFLAYAGIIQSLSLLTFVLLLHTVPEGSVDYLIAYAGGYCFLQVLYMGWHMWYVKRKYKLGMRLSGMGWKSIKQVSGFFGWSVLGSAASMGQRQGVNLILNNVVKNLGLNAAMGLAETVASKVNVLTANFQQAFHPQITQEWALGHKETVYALVAQTAKFSFFLLYLVSFPLILHTEFVLDLWLGTGHYPILTPNFIRLTLFAALIEAISGPLWITMYANGKIAVYQVVVSVLLLSCLPISYVLLSYGYPPETALWVRISVFSLILGFRLVLLKAYVKLPVLAFLRDAILPCLVIAGLSQVMWYFSADCVLWWQILLMMAAETILLLVLIWLIGLKQRERLWIKDKLRGLLQRRYTKGKP